MKNVLISICAVSAAMCWGAPTLTVDFVNQNPDSRLVTIGYTVGNEPAVVTLDSIVADGVPLDESKLADVQGDVNKLIQPGSSHRLYWKPDDSVKGAAYTIGSFTVTAWATNAPPNYMVIDLLNKAAERVYYYTSTNCFPVPLSDESYRTTKLVMRRIPAAGVTFRMGSPTDETGRQTSTNYEATHYVSFNEDFYLGIYPVTRRQHNLLTGKNSSNYFVNYGEGLDWPVTGIQLCALRTWIVESGVTPTHKYWPHDGHELDYDSGHTSGNLLYFMRQNFPGFMFDLPTEAQWEFACRGGATTYEARYGNVDEIAWTSNNSLSSEYNVYLPHSVGQLKPNGYGLYDMLGNVWEKMLDAWETMPNDTTVRTDPTGPDLGIARDTRYVIRGGAFSCEPRYARAANRSYSTLNAVQENSIRVTSNNATVSGTANGNTYSFGYRLWLPAHAVK